MEGSVDGAQESFGTDLEGEKKMKKMLVIGCYLILRSIFFDARERN